MEALSIFSHRGLCSPSNHFDSDASPSRTSPRINGRRAHPHVSLTSVHGGRRNSNSSNGFSSTFPNFTTPIPKMASFAASFPPALAHEEESVVCNEHSASTTTAETSGKATVVEMEIPQARKEKGSAGKKRIDVRALARKLWDCTTSDDVDKLFDEMSDSPPPQVFSTIVKGLGADKKLDSAFALMEWLRKKGKSTDHAIGLNIFMYNSLLGALKQNRRFEDVDRVMEDMREEGIRPGVVTYNALMSISIERGRPREALDLLCRIEKDGLVPSPVTYSLALLAYRKLEEPHGALQFYAELRDKDTRGEICRDGEVNWEEEFGKMKVYTINTCCKVMREWLASGRDPTSDTMKLLATMDRLNVTLGRDEYEKLLWACTEAPHFHVTKELYGRLRDLDCRISLSVCNHSIWLMGKAKKWWAALEVYEDLLDKGPKPNNLSYELIVSHFNILLNAARRKGMWRWGMRLIDKMEDKGLKLGSREWNAVLIACSKASESSTAVRIFRRMIEKGEKPNILSYGALLSALEKGEHYDEALQVWDHMRKVGVQPNLHAYTILITVYIGRGDLEKVDSLIREMDSVEITPSVVTFNAIISGCTRSNLPGTAFEWYHLMKSRGIAPNEITYDVLIQSLAQDGKPKLAYEMYIRAFDEGLELPPRAYDSILKSCQRHGVCLDLDNIAPRPPEKKKTIGTRAPTASSNFADTPSRGSPSDVEEMIQH